MFSYMKRGKLSTEIKIGKFISHNLQWINKNGQLVDYNEITRDIQQKVREVKERTQRAVGEDKSPDREIGNGKSNSDKGIESTITKDTKRVRERVRELTR